MARVLLQNYTLDESYEMGLTYLSATVADDEATVARIETMMTPKQIMRALLQVNMMLLAQASDTVELTGDEKDARELGYIAALRQGHTSRMLAKAFDSDNPSA
jgi:hypothetical protein